MAELLTNTTDLTKVADAIREKGGTSDSLVYPDGFVTAIQAIQTGTELQIIATVTSGAVVTATKGSLSVSGTSVDGTCTLTVPEEGEWTVSAELGGETSESNIVNVVSSYDTALVFISTILNDNSWEAIHRASDAGTGANYWSIGDRKAVTLNGTVGKLSLPVNSFHHQASAEPADGLIVSARSPDGSVEALEATGKKFILGVQWHPEHMTVEPEQSALFRALVGASC